MALSAKYHCEHRQIVSRGRSDTASSIG